MPLLTTINPWPKASVYLWDISESEDELLALSALSVHSRERLDSMKSPVHRKGFLSVRALLNRAGLSDEDLYYNSFGKPFLHQGGQISITHSHARSAIIVAPYNVGIDIELRRPKILRIAHKFCGGISPELKGLVSSDIDQYTHVWTAKESIYKMASMPGLGFLSDITLSDWRPESKAGIQEDNDKASNFILAKGTITQAKGTLFAYKGFELGDYICGMTKDTASSDHEE